MKNFALGVTSVLLLGAFIDLDKKNKEIKRLRDMCVKHNVANNHLLRFMRQNNVRFDKETKDNYNTSVEFETLMKINKMK